MNTHIQWKNGEYITEGSIVKMPKRIYHGDKIKTIGLDEIHSEGVKEKIGAYEEMITSFVSVLNQILPQEHRLDAQNRLFDIKRTYGESSSFEDDGNTRAEGFDYNVIWSYALTNTVQENWRLRNDMQEKCLYFVLETAERVRDNKGRRYHFFSMYLSGHEDVKGKGENRIDNENENYKLGAILNKKNLATVVMEIEAIMKRQGIYDQVDAFVRKHELEKEFK